MSAVDIHRGRAGRRVTILSCVASSDDDAGTVATPLAARRPGNAEVTVPLAQPPVVPRVYVPEQRTETARRRRESAAPLDFSRDKTIGRFEMIREIARGGMGQVFLARDVKLGRKVAIKFLLSDDPQFLQRFLVEARATARCTHENIVTIFEVGEHASRPYMVLEYLEGKTLSEVLESKPSLRQF